MNLKFNDTIITSDEAKTRLKAFLDDLAALQNRHSLYIEQD